MKIYVYTALAFLVVALGATLWFGGHHSGYIEGKGKLDQVLADDKAAATAAAAKAKGDKDAHEQQVKTANFRLDAALAQLAAIDSAPHPRIVCRAAPPGRPVPSPPASAGGGAPGAGTLSQDAGFDPGKRAYPEVADECDALVESYRHTLAIWPQ